MACRTRVAQIFLHDIWFVAASAFLVLAISAVAASAGGDFKPVSKYQAEKPKRFATFSGSNYKEDSYFTYMGGIYSLSGDLGKNGFVGRAFVGYGNWEYDLSNNPPVEVEGDKVIFDAMLGYQAFFGGWRSSWYVGVEHQETDLSPLDPSNRTRGGATGAKVQGELERVHIDRFFFSLYGSYSGANSSYWTQARAGIKFNNLILGPEVAGIGDEEYESVRVGGFARFEIKPFRRPIRATLSAGYASDSGRGGDDSIYGTLGFLVLY